MPKFSRLLFALALLVCAYAESVEVLEPQPYPPVIRNTSSTEQNGGVGFQVNASNAGNESFHIVVDSAGATSLQKLTSGVKFDAIGTKNTMPSSGTSVYAQAPYSCSSSNTIAKINCASGTVPSGPYDSTGVTLDTTGLTGGYLVKEQTSATCADLDASNVSGYTRYDLGDTYNCSGGGSTPCKGDTLCAHYALWDGSNNLVLAQAKAGRTTFGSTSNCFVAVDVFECETLGPPDP